MPYINKNQREGIEAELNVLLNVLSGGPGELNYVITRILLDSLGYQTLHYEKVNMLVGVLECAKLELYRRLAAPYEDQKIEENGDVY